MRIPLVLALLAVPAFALAEGERVVHKGCEQPLCACQDAARPEGCPDPKACAAFCEDHGGTVEWHKKHRRRHTERLPQHGD